MPVPGAVEAAVAQHDPARLGRQPLEPADRGVGLADALRRVRVQRVGLGLDRAAGALARPAGERLRDQQLAVRRRQQVLGALGPQPVREREGLVDVAHVDAGQRGHLVDDHVGVRGLDRGLDGGGVEAVHDLRRGAERAQLAGLGLGAGGAGDGVAVGDQERDQCTAGGARGACDEDVHGP